MFNYYHLTNKEAKMIHQIKKITEKNNLDNISRTMAYERFYLQHQEIRWAFLASMVSRNAGYSMTDLMNPYFRILLQEKDRALLFETYERANWLIFDDAYPQLLLYAYSVKYSEPLFHLLRHFHVSTFMEQEWNYYWQNKDNTRLLIALIINEQNIIQKPVIEHPYYKKHVFKEWPFRMQELFHFSAVIFPTCSGKLYGYSATRFQNVNERIRLGKKLAALLFHEELYHQFLTFSKTVVHTGSRYDYEQFLSHRHTRDTPLLRIVFPTIRHERNYKNDWLTDRKYKTHWQKPIRIEAPNEITKWYSEKRKQIKAMAVLQSLRT